MLAQFKNIFKEPFVQFILLGGLLFFTVSYVQHKKNTASREIIVDNNRIGLMMVNYKSQTGNLPTKEQLDAMINNYIKEEISYREAIKMGLSKDDEIIRRRLSQKFDFMQTDLTEITPPSEGQLKEFYTNNPALFQKGATVSFSHIYFSTDKSNDSVAKQKALTVLQDVTNSHVQRAPEKGDRFPLQYDYTNQAVEDIQQNFGSNQFLDTLFKAPVDTWIGPVKSGYGWHLIFISKRGNTVEIPFASVKEDVKTKFINAAKEVQNTKVFDKLSKKYIITRAYLETK